MGTSLNCRGNRSALRALLIATSAVAGMTRLSNAANLSAVFTGPPSGSWNAASNWSTLAVPNNGNPAGTNYDVFIDGGAPTNHAVTYDAGLGFSILSLNISTGDQLLFGNNTQLNVNGALNNAGTISVSSTSGNAILSIAPGNSISGGGAITLSGNAFLTGSGTITNVDNTITGSGNVGNNSIIIVNQATINANASGAVLTIDPANNGALAGLTNTGSLLASNGGTLSLTGSNSGFFDNSAGTIQAQNSSAVSLTTGAGIVGGTFSTVGTGSIRTAAGQIIGLTNVTNTGNFVGENNSDTDIAGSMVNSGSINLNSTGSTTRLVMTTGSGSTVTFSGGGVINMVGAQTFIGGSGTFLNQNNTLRGQGNLGQNAIAIVNGSAGLIDANVAGQVLFVDPANLSANPGLTNSGTMQASGGGILQLSGESSGFFVNTSTGQIQALNGSEVQLLSNASVSGGTLTTAGSGVIRALTGQTVGISSLNNAGNFVIDNNDDTQVNGAIVNSGSFSLNAVGSSTRLVVVGGAATFSGGGTVNLNGDSAAIGGSGTFTNIDNTLHGHGNIGQNGVAIVNSGTIAADVAGTTLVIDPPNVPGSGMTNTGTMLASGGGALVLTGANSGSFDNTGGMIQALNGSTVSLTTSVSITAPVFTTVGTGVIQTDPGQTVTLSNTSLTGNFIGQNNSATQFVGTTLVNGSININAGSSTTILSSFNGSIALSGTGVVNLNQGVGGTGGAAQITGGGTLNNNILIQGAGNVGANSTEINNAATISANVSGSALLIDPPNLGATAGLVNTGLMQATGGGILVLTGSNSGFFDNSAGTILAAANSEVQLTTAVSILGGKLIASGASSDIRNLTGQVVGLTNVSLAGNYINDNNSDTDFAGTLTNAGSINLNAAVSTSRLILTGGDGTLTGGGVVNMNGANAQITGLNHLTNVNNTIHGVGNIAVNAITFTNAAAGLIDANVSAGVLTLDPANAGGNNAFINAGIEQATNGGILQFTGSNSGGFSNTGAGFVQALAGSEIQFVANASITGGTLTSVGTGLLRTVAGNNAFLDNLTMSGMYIGSDNTITQITGTINTTGTFSLQPTANGVFFRPGGGTVTLTGGGSVILNATTGATGFDQIDGTGTLVNVNNIIRGTGNIGANSLAITNQSEIVADVSGKVLFVDPPNLGATAGFVNTGSLLAINGGILQLTGSNSGFLSNTGSIAAQGAGAEVQLITNATITGGLLTTSGGGILRTAANNNAFLDNLTMSGMYIGSDNTITQITGTINNTGTFSMQPTASGVFFRAGGGTVTLTGGGSVILNASTGTTGFDQIDGSGTLVNVNNTIIGTGNIGVNALTIVNQGSIIASGGSLTIDPPNLGTLPGFLSTGTLGAQTGATLVLTGSNSGFIDNSAGQTVIAAGGTLSLVSNITFLAGNVILNGFLDQSNGNLTAGGVSGTGTFSQTSASTTNVQYLRVGTLNLSAGTINIIAGGGTLGTSDISSGTINVTVPGRLNLSDHDLIVDYTSPNPSPAAAIRALIISGRNGGSWNGNGLTSSAAASIASDNSNPHKTALGYGEASTVGITTTFRGLPVDSTAVLVRYTFLGDANLDGLVNALDFNAVATNFGGSGKGWTDGDFDYNGIVNTLDFTQLASNFNLVLPSPAVESPVLGSLVPEPSLLGAVTLACGLRMRRRRPQRIARKRICYFPSE